MSVASGRIGELVARLLRSHERRARDSYAGALERAVEEVDEPLSRAGAAVPIDRSAVAEAAPALLQLAARLRSSGDLPTEAMRLSRLLLSDGAGPLYARTAHRTDFPPGTLARCVWGILAVCDRGQTARGPAELVRL